MTTLADARAALDRFGAPVVVKADGLAAGKGVTVATTRAEADAAIADLFAVPGAQAVIEEYMEGEEVSLFVLTDGRTLLPFGTAQDHKRVGEGDTGPNTGGMGAYSPAAVLTPALEAQAMREIIAPTVAALAAAGTPFSGVLFAGLMLTAAGPKLIEYNARFGDPECQVLMARFDGDLLATMLCVADERLNEAPPARFSDEGRAERGAGGARLSGSARGGGGDRGDRRDRGDGCPGLPGRDPHDRRRAGRRGRPCAGGHGDGHRCRRRAGTRLCRCRCDRFP